MKNSLVYIILLNYNGCQLTLDCVESLRKITYPNYRIVIVDNDSTDNSESILREKLKDCTILQSGHNSGFAAGNNIGIKYALDNKADYVLLLNNDTLADENFLTHMLESFGNDEAAGLVGCKIMYYPDKDLIWYAGGTIDWSRFINTHLGHGEPDKGQYDREQETEFITGCCILVKREVFEKIGLLPTEYFMYYEDMDFSVKARDNGFKLIYNPQAVIYHKVSISSGGEESAFAVKWNTRNRIIFMNKYKCKVSPLNYLKSQGFFYLTRVIKYFQYFIKDRSKAAALLSGVVDGRRALWQSAEELRIKIKDKR